jgi:hypothetical protein
MKNIWYYMIMEVVNLTFAILKIVSKMTFLLRENWVKVQFKSYQVSHLIKVY